MEYANHFLVTVGVIDGSVGLSGLEDFVEDNVTSVFDVRVEHVALGDGRHRDNHYVYTLEFIVEPQLELEEVRGFMKFLAEEWNIDNPEEAFIVLSVEY